MRSLRFFDVRVSRGLLATLFLSGISLAGSSLLALACGSGDDSTAAPANDAGSDASDASVADQDAGAVPIVDASQTHCTLFDGTDPVGLCVQKTLLTAMHAILTDGGIPASWDPKSGAPDIDDGGATLHRLHDDAAYGAALARYQFNAVQYGDNDLQTIVYADLPRIAAILESEMSTLPNEYGGELYRDLRYVAVGLRYVDANTEATKIDAIADAYGRAIFDKFYRAIGADDGVFGVDDGAGGVAYDAVDATTGAFAIVDMSTNHAPDPATAAKWQKAGLTTVDHVWARARDGVTGLIPRTLVTSSVGAGDTPTSAGITSDAQATIALALLRMRELVPADAAAAPALAAYPFAAHGAEAIANANDALLWDDAGAGYFTGLEAEGGVDTSKPTRANALMAAAIQRSGVVAPSPYRSQVVAIRKLLLEPSPTSSGLFAAILDQVAFFPALTRDFKLPDPSAGPRARHYESAATAAACEGLSDMGTPVPGATP